MAANIIERETTVHGRALTPGWRFKVKGSRYYLTYLRRVTSPSGDTWIDAEDRDRKCRSVFEESIQPSTIAKPTPERAELEAMRAIQRAADEEKAVKAAAKPKRKAARRG